MQLGRFGQTAPFAAFLHGTLEGFRPPLSALAVLALALGGRRTAASAALVRDRREEMADARLVGDVEAVGAPWGRTRCHGHGRDEVGDGEQKQHAGREAGWGQYGMSAWEHRMR